jgi:hypothetical protein
MPESLIVILWAVLIIACLAAILAVFYLQRSSR